MRNTLLIARRELGAYFRSMFGYTIAALMLLAVGLLFQGLVLGEGEQRSSQVLGQFFWVASGTVMIGSIALSMRLLAEEKQNGTLPLLTSSPVLDREIIFGKYLSGLVFLGLITLATVYIPLLIMMNGKVSFGHLFAGYLGLLLLGGTTLAIGTFGSAVAKSQLMALIISAVLVVVMILAWMLARVTERPFNEFFASVALYHKHFTPFQQGVIHLRDIVYYLAVTYFALFSATRVLEARRWR